MSELIIDGNKFYVVEADGSQKEFLSLSAAEDYLDFLDLMEAA